MKTIQSRNVQIFPRGECLTIADNGEGYKIRTDKGKWRKATSDENKRIKAQELAERYIETEIYCCDSSLVDDMLKTENPEWSFENVSNVYPDPSDWDEEQCREWLCDKGHDALEGEKDVDLLREAVQDNAEAAEIFEWWRVSKWLAAKLNEIGKCVLDNNYGHWWGRCATGQNMIMDGTIQQIAARLL